MLYIHLPVRFQNFNGSHSSNAASALEKSREPILVLNVEQGRS